MGVHDCPSAFLGTTWAKQHCHWQTQSLSQAHLKNWAYSFLCSAIFINISMQIWKAATGGSGACHWQAPKTNTLESSSFKLYRLDSLDCMIKYNKTSSKQIWKLCFFNQAQNVRGSGLFGSVNNTEGVFRFGDLGESSTSVAVIKFLEK